MGTDCGFLLERREGGQWRPITPSPADLDTLVGWLQNRDYTLYSILAGDVRGRGTWCEPVVPVRGFPADSPVVGKLAGQPDRGECHNATWMTIAELDAFPWRTKTIAHEAYLDGTGYLELLLDGAPRSWLDWHGDREAVSADLMESRLNRGQRTHHLLTKVTLNTPYGYFAEPFLKHVLPVLRRQGPPADVRLILSFDS